MPEEATWADRVLGPNFNALDAAKRLRVAIDRVGGNKGIMAKTGIPSRTLSFYLAGRDMKRLALVALAKACDVNIAWLAAGEGPMTGQPQSQTQSLSPLNAERPFKAFTTVKVDVMAQALLEAQAKFEDAGASPTTRELVQVTLLLYDGLNKKQEL